MVITVDHHQIISLSLKVRRKYHDFIPDYQHPSQTIRRRLEGGSIAIVVGGGVEAANTFICNAIFDTNNILIGWWSGRRWKTLSYFQFDTDAFTAGGVIMHQLRYGETLSAVGQGGSPFSHTK
jgi:hypothetical protein